MFEAVKVDCHCEALLRGLRNFPQATGRLEAGGDHRTNPWEVGGEDLGRQAVRSSSSAP
jgi:hypothetical protein